MNFYERITKIIEEHNNLENNLSRKEVIKDIIDRKEGILTKNNSIAIWNESSSTGRSPKDTVTVKNNNNKNKIDWNSPNNIAITEETFDMLFSDAEKILEEKEKLYVIERVIGADETQALPVRVITDKAVTALFVDNMFRKIPENINKSVFKDKIFTLLVIGNNKFKAEKYENRLRKLPNGKTSDIAVAMDYDRNAGIVFGSSYCGSVKKLMFTAMNYYLPEVGILPLHCSANEGEHNDITLFLGLSGTGKTTLSADPKRALLGDDEHSWSDNGISNFENGCYAKLIDLNFEKEPEIYDAVFHEAPYLEHGAIVENVMVYPNGDFDLSDNRFTENTRGSYPLTFLKNIKLSSIGDHPKVIIFLTADATGVLPPVAKLLPEQAMLWFLMGYTSKLAGTETGIVDPVATFSRFFGEPFMPLNPDIYAKLLGEKMKKHNTSVFLINTGWSGGAYGIGKRMDISLTRSLVNAAISGELNNVEYKENKLFHIMIPLSCGNIDPNILEPENTWKNKNEYKKAAEKLASKFSEHFDKMYNGKVDKIIEIQCPGK